MHFSFSSYHPTVLLFAILIIADDQSFILFAGLVRKIKIICVGLIREVGLFSAVFMISVFVVINVDFCTSRIMLFVLYTAYFFP